MTLSYWWMHWFWITCRFTHSGGDQHHLHYSTTFPSVSPVSSDYIPNTTTTLTPARNNMSFDANETEAPEFNITTDSYMNETGAGAVTFNQSLVLNSERIGDRTEEVGHLSAAGITGITLGCVFIVGIVCGVTFFLYRNRGFNRPQVLNDRCSNPDSSGYLDDASVRDNSEEMYSLDNDSFLNSLEAMTIQNYWTDTVKHTKL